MQKYQKEKPNYNQRCNNTNGCKATTDARLQKMQNYNTDINHHKETQHYAKVQRGDAEPPQIL